jgi:hypothetical protein
LRLNQNLKIDLNQKPPSLDRYRSMTQNQRNVLIKSLYVNENDKIIFNVLHYLHTEIQVQKIDLQGEDFTFNDEDVRRKFSVVYTSFRIAHPNMYGHLDRLLLNYEDYFMFNKFDDGEDSYYLKFIYCPEPHIYCYLEMNPITKNYRFYESKLDEHIGFDLIKGREYNEDAVNNWYQMLPMNPKLKIE